ncbi:MAG TPA: hypothetical protein VHK90_01190 [Thermoanaerobaculia bacterium]|nr:hypothetical protein [Thermoanaerobaculia bacterium]
MATSSSRPGLPDAKSVVLEIPFGVAPETAAAGAAPAPAFRIIRTNEVDAYETPVSKRAVAEAATLEAAVRGDNFKGKSRKASKLSLADAKMEKFADLADLIASLPKDKVMAAKKIPTDAKSKRVPEENRNVRVEAWIYAASVEDDNDFHLILGRDPDGGGTPVYMTMELSGLPATNAKSHPALSKARDAFKKFFRKFFENNLPGKSYDFYDPPIRVQVEGSLFFDATHAKGSKPGPKSLRKDIPTVWEVHPISKMKLFPPG